MQTLSRLPHALTSGLLLAGVWLAPCLGGVGLAQAGEEAKAPLSVTFSQAKTLEEGRPGRLDVTFTNTSKQPWVLQALNVQAGGDQARRSFAGGVEALNLTPLGERRLLVVRAQANEAGNKHVARAMRPPLTAGLRAAPYAALRLLHPKQKLRLSLQVVPGDKTLKPTWSYRVVPFTPGKVPAYVRVSSRSWNPLAEGAQQSTRASKTSISIQAEVWDPWSTQPAERVLVSRRDLARLVPETFKGGKSLSVLPAPFGAKAALARAGLKAARKAVRLKDGRWLFESREAGLARWDLVAATGPASKGKGRVFPFALSVASQKQVSFLWYGSQSAKPLHAALKASGYVTAEGKGATLRVAPANLLRFLELLAQHGHELGRNGIRKLRALKASSKPSVAPQAGAVLEVSPKHFSGYPAAFVSLERGQIVRLPKSFAGYKIKADLWIEPNDPEVGGIGDRFEGALHSGSATRVALVAGSFAALKAAPRGLKWTDSLPRRSVRAGALFLVRTSSGQVHKVLLERVDPKAQVLRLRYARLK